jgi:hypothetical protein
MKFLTKSVLILALASVVPTVLQSGICSSSDCSVAGCIYGDNLKIARSHDVERERREKRHNTKMFLTWQEAYLAQKSAQDSAQHETTRKKQKEKNKHREEQIVSDSH